MKIQRYKKAHKTLTFYKNNFGFREPFQLLIDATFCQAALQVSVIVEFAHEICIKNLLSFLPNHLQFQINITDQLPKYIQAPTQLITTQCIILEAESLGPKVQGATSIVKQFLVHKCGHEKSPKSATACIKSVVRQNRYIVATQDRTLQDRLRERVGQPLLYLHRKTPVLEQPGQLSRKSVELKMNEAVTFGKQDANKLVALKKTHGLDAANSATAATGKKVKKKKQPNPLSCKKKKTKTNNVNKSDNKQTKSSDANVEKKKRKRVKIPLHVKEILAGK